MAAGMTVTDLAERVGMTPRNIRAYQSRGLLFAPQISGRKARYTAAHVARLELIASLQREGFSLAAIKRLLERPDSYASVIADRRRRFRTDSNDMVESVPVSRQRMAALGPEQRTALIEHGLVWEHHGELRTHTLVAGINSTLVEQGVSGDLLRNLLIQVAQAASTAGAELARGLENDDPEASVAADQRRADLALVAVQLLSAGFEVTCARAVAAPLSQPPRR